MNSLHLIGRLGNDPKTFGNGSITKLSVATKDGEYTNWVPVTCFGKLAETCAAHLKKGQRVSIEARVQQNSYERAGKRIYEVQVVASKIDFLDHPARVNNTEDNSEEE